MTNRPIFAALFAALLAQQSTARAEEVAPRVLHAELLHEAERHRLNADLEYRFSDAAIDALHNGVPLTLVLKLQVRPDRYFWWGENLIDQQWAFRVRYHSLAKLYQWVQDDSGRPRGFASLAALLEEMGAVRRLEIATAAPLVAGQRFHARLAVSLDIEALPLPLRPIAYLSPDWHLGSPWYEWSFVD